MDANDVKKELQRLSVPGKAEICQRFFKTGPGEYGEEDVFLGVTMPEIRSVVKRFRSLPLREVKRLLASEVHEHRMAGLLLLVDRYGRGDAAERKRVYECYLASTDRINNWDLVDVTAHKVVGEYLVDRSRAVLKRLARSELLWERRIAVISTFAFIRRGELDDSLMLAEMLLDDDHDLMHKAVGWVLREVGKKDVAVLERFLKKHHAEMPRTMLRYAIERLPEKKRKAYLRGHI